MALTDIKIRTDKPTDKQYKLTDGNGMHLLVHLNGSRYWRLQYRCCSMLKNSYCELGSGDRELYTVSSQKQQPESL
ncbi:Arm DNA-binding domain-containing protein [Photorhabdus tasmaniensis]|uniref:Arm DNA-binding domain-containing protein n=1 Tax=Photorhabdus tasmaniensis TaxID=1004159 RepID=UPI004041588B